MSVKIVVCEALYVVERKWIQGNEELAFETVF